MPTSTALALLVATSFVGFLCFPYVSRMANDTGHQVVTGVVDGKSVPLSYRWILLHQIWVSNVLIAVAAVSFTVVVGVYVARHVAEPGVRLIAYFGAFLGGTGAFSWVVAGVSEFLYFRSVLRQAEAD
jgi:hypothetical protein